MCSKVVFVVVLIVPRPPLGSDILLLSSLKVAMYKTIGEDAHFSGMIYISGSNQYLAFDSKLKVGWPR